MTKIKKVMLISPANTMSRESVRRLSTPLGLMSLGAILRDKGYEVNILDSPCEGYYTTSVHGEYLTYGLAAEHVAARIQDFNPDVVGVTSMFTAHQKNALAQCDLVKSVKDVPVILGGIHPSLDPLGSIKSASVDFIIMGEGEYRLPKLLEAIESGAKPDFEGVAYKTGSSSVVHPMTSRIKDLDSLPPLARDMVNMERYISIGVPFGPFTKRDRAEQIMTSRGCPFNCNFCSTVGYWGHSFRTRSVDNVLEEVKLLVDRYGIQEIQFADDNLTVKKDRAKEIFRRLADYNLSWCTPHGLMVQTLDEEMISLMARSGAYQLTFAIESASQRVLKEIVHKSVPDKKRIKDLVDRCHNEGIQVHGLFIVGFPGEKREEVMKTLRYPFETNFDSASFFIATPMIGSELYKQCQEKGYLVENAGADLQHAAINIPQDSPDFVMPPEELEQLTEENTRKFNELAKEKNPGAWEAKFKQFLRKHGENADLILGRVT